MSEIDLDSLRDELSEFAVAVKTGGYTPREERILAGFEDIQRFVEENQRVPQHGEDRDIFERLYAVRLERIRTLPEAQELLGSLDHQGLLSADSLPVGVPDLPSIDELAAELGEVDASEDIRNLRHVVSREEKRAAEEIANRTPCADFAEFEPIFAKTESDLQAGLVLAKAFGKDIRINKSDLFVLGGQITFVASKGAEFKTPQGEPDARLRVIYSNGTESNLLMRSLQRALYKDEAGRRIVDNSAPTLFGSEMDEGDEASGTIYVVRSNSEVAYIREHRDLIHKIGVTGGTVAARVSRASTDSTYLLADVEVVATYTLAGISRSKFEALLQKVLAPAQLQITLEDRFGNPVKPTEWFLVPLAVIDDVISRIQDGSIVDFTYVPGAARLIAVS